MVLQNVVLHALQIYGAPDYDAADHNGANVTDASTVTQAAYSWLFPRILLTNILSDHDT